MTEFVKSLLRLVDLDGTVPDFSRLSRRQKIPAVNIPYQGRGRWLLSGSVRFSNMSECYAKRSFRCMLFPPKAVLNHMRDSSLDTPARLATRSQSAGEYGHTPT
ncbi:hypothetical protein G0P99_15280 [Ruegeria sp. PrR005]|uniref:Uncharacterized protein n=1 Tax=Ruegeria sp. PrR005 TaxID=2706882 RepID=A0A6B2NQB2_9RHOB|nr:hypothetical protein [Ruegeria sp. PrR005]